MKFSIGLLYVRPSVSQSVSQLKTIKARSIKLGTRIGSNVYNMHAQNLGCYLEGQGHKMTAKSCPLNYLGLFEVWFYNYFTEMITILRWRVTHKFGLVPWRSRSQYDLPAKSCPAHNFVIWSRILQLFHRNDHHIEMRCRAQNLGRYLEGQGHSMTLQQNCVWPITLLFEVRFYNYFTEMITILKWCVTTLPIVWLCAYYTALF